MKGRTILICVFTLFFSCTGLQAQIAMDNNMMHQNETTLLEQEESRIEQYIQLKLSDEFPEAELQRFLSSIENTESDHHHTSEIKNEISEHQKEELLLNYKKHYYRVQYFKQHPEATKAYNTSISLSNDHQALNKNYRSPLQCPNGDFESGLIGYIGLSNSSTNNTGDFNSGGCNYIDSPNNITIVPIPRVNQIELTNNLPDPILSAEGITLMQTHNGSGHAVRINSPYTNNSTALPCFGFYIVDGIRRTFTTTDNIQNSLSLAYALVMEDPSHEPGKQPFFMARLLDGNGNELPGRICRIADANDPFFNSLSGELCDFTDTARDVVYSDWICDQLYFPPGSGQTYTLEIYVADCALGQHNSYAYVDDICLGCSPNNNSNWGGVSLNPTDTCDKTMQVCASYIPPRVNGVDYSVVSGSPALTITQNGIPTGISITSSTVNTTAQTICFNINPTTLGFLIGGFDFELSVDFSLGSTTVTRTDIFGSNTGVNNDYTTVSCPVTTPCDCGSWSQVRIADGKSIVGMVNCNSSLTYNFQAGQTYQLRYKYNCAPQIGCKPVYNVTDNLNGNVTTLMNAGFLEVTFTPNVADCGSSRSIQVSPTCDGKFCPSCRIDFNVSSCDWCVGIHKLHSHCGKGVSGQDPLKTYADFQIRNIGTQSRSYFGITIPTGVSFTNLTPTTTATVVYNSGNYIVFQTANPLPATPANMNNIPANVLSGMFLIRIDGGLLPGQNVALQMESFSSFISPTNNQGRCTNPAPFYTNILDCQNDCADIIDASINCNASGQRVLRYKLRNNRYPSLHSYESNTVFNTGTDNFFSFFNPPLAFGSTSTYINHIIPNSIPSGGVYCFENKVHMYVFNGMFVDSTCMTDVMCVQIPSCLGSGINKKSNDNMVNEKKNSDVFRIFPNPTTDILNIQSEGNRINHVKISDIAGKLILDEKKNELIFYKLNIANLPKGIYILKINDTQVYRIIKK